MFPCHDRPSLGLAPRSAGFTTGRQFCRIDRRETGDLEATDGCSSMSQTFRRAGNAWIVGPRRCRSSWLSTCWRDDLMTSRPKVALLEARMSRELARLVEKHGGAPRCVPAVRESGEELDDAVADRLITALADGHYDIAVFMTGVAVSLLFETAEGLQRRPDLVAGLRRVTTVCRGPKPTAALRGFGVVPTLTAREAFTSAEVIDAFAGLELKGRRVLLFHYGERSDALAETLLAREAILEEQWLYRWRLPEDTSGLEGLVSAIIRGDVDALAVTCQIQFRHLF